MALVLGAEGTENYFACDLGVGERLFELFNVLVHGRQLVTEVAFVNNGASTHALSVPDTHTCIHIQIYTDTRTQYRERDNMVECFGLCIFESPVQVEQ